MFRSKRRFSKTVGSSIGFAKYTWNVVTGCLHGCSYCYARSIAKRFPRLFPRGFEPDFRATRLLAPESTPLPKEAGGKHRRVFVSSMGDLFGEWVPAEQIELVLRFARPSPDWEYVFLTKNPIRYLEIAEWPVRCWVGTTVDTQARVAEAERVFSQLDVPYKVLSCEPMLEELTFSNLQLFDLVMIGGQTGPQKKQPNPAWVASLVSQCRESGVAVFFKDNLTLQIVGGSLDDSPDEEIAITPQSEDMDVSPEEVDCMASDVQPIPPDSDAKASEEDMKALEHMTADELIERFMRQ